MKKSTYCVAAAAFRSNVQQVRLRSKPCHALHLELFERPRAVVGGLLSVLTSVQKEIYTEGGSPVKLAVNLNPSSQILYNAVSNS